VVQAPADSLIGKPRSRVPPNNAGWVGHCSARNVDIRLPARTPLMLPCTTTRGLERLDLPRLGSANKILVVTRENVPERTLYFLQHRWRLCDYVRTPLRPLTSVYSWPNR
jgi:hypothetical protein